MALTETLAAIGDAIRRKTGNREPIPLEKMPEVIDNIPTVALKLQEKLVTENGRVTPDFWSNGLSAVQVAVDTETPYNDGLAEGLEQGKKAEYDAFWDANQEFGNRTDYDYAYDRSGWTDDNFKPKYLIKPKTATQIFAQNQKLSVIPELDFTVATTVSSAFTGSLATTIEKIISSATTPWPRLCFNGAKNLVNVVFDGVIGQGAFYFVDSKLLSHDSMISLFNAIADGTTGTIELGETNLAKLTEEEIAIATEKGWTVS